MMSISDLRHEATQVRLSRKRDITGRHKEILTEFFYFTKHPDVPPDSETIFEQAISESNDLNEFLLQNDLESGHVFQESTLPQIQTVAVNATPEVIEVNTTAAKAPLPPPQTPQNVNTTPLPSQPTSTGSGRMITRVSSGAIRHKSVGELLGEKDFTPKSTPSRLIDTFRDPNAIESLASGFQDPSSLPKPSNPVPSRTTRGAMFQDLSTQGPASGKVDLDRLQAAAEIFPLEHVVSKMAHKSVRTTDWTSAIDEKKTIAVCARIAELKEQGLWSFRQPLKQKPPPRVISHWDYMLKEMEWMSTDFYEERKFKMVGAYRLSKAVKQYFDSSDRASLLHKWPKRLRVATKSAEDEVDADEDVLMVNHRGSASPMSMDHHTDMAHDAENLLVNGAHDGSVPMIIDGRPESPKLEREMVREPATLPTPSPSSCGIDDFSAIFDLPPDEIYAVVNELPKTDGSSFPQLPIYGPPTVTHEPYHNPIDDLPIVPVSKFCQDNYVVKVAEWKPPKRSYRQTTPEQSDGLLEISKEVQVEAGPSFAPAGSDAAHASRRRSLALVIRPPPPPTHWSEQKSPPWTPEEERMLLQSAKDNLYNFELVASTLSFPGTSASDLEKRSAWECFEKFRSIYPEPQNIQLTGPNRNNAMNRLEKGNRLSVSSGSKPKPNTIVRQPRLEVRDHRYLNLFDVMKRSAKNREKAKAQEKPPVKKTKDNPPTKAAVNVPTPLDLSRLKAERDRALNQALLAERQAQAVRLQLPPNATPEQQEEARRTWYLQQQALLNAQAGGQALRQGAGLGRGLVIPGGPNGRPMPIRPNTGPNPVPGGTPLRLPNGAIATTEQVQQMLKQQQIRIAQARAMHQQQQQQAQLNAAQNGGQPAATPNTMPDYIPFMAQQANGATPQAQSQVGNLVQNNRMMQPPQQNGAVAQGMRQATPQQQLSLPQQPGQGLRATPPRPPNLSPTGTHFAPSPNINLQTILAIVQQNNPKLSMAEATKVAVEHMTRLQAESMRNAAGANGLMQQHLQQQLAKSSPTQQNQQIRRSPSQNANPPHPQGQQRL